MISLLFYQLFISITCFNAGYIFYSAIYPDKILRIAEKGVVLLFTGLVVLTLLCQILVLFAPVNFYTSLALFGLLQLASFRKRHQYYRVLKKFVVGFQDRTWLVKTGIITTTALLLLLTTGPTLMDDTESYHIQMVKWIQEYGTVPGIANLHERYGFNSSWFSSVALFSLPGFYNYYTVLNSVVSVWLSLYLWMQASAGFNRQRTIALMLLCATLVSWPLLRGNVSTVNYDFITTAMVLILFLEAQMQPDDRPETLNLIYILWPVYLFTVRIINFPLLLLSLITLIQSVRKKDNRTALISFSLSVLLVAPFLARNVFLSGYAFFPGFYLNFFNVDWKVDSKVIDDLLYYIKYYNRVNNMYQPLAQTANLCFPDWIVSWYQHLFYYDKPLIIAGFSGFVGSLFLLKQKSRNNKKVLSWLAILLLHLLVWFLIAPDPRFVYGPFLCGIALLLRILIAPLNEVVVKKISFAVMGGVLLFTSVLFISKVYRDERYRNVFVCQQLPRPGVQKIKLGSVDLFIPDRILDNWNPRCYATALPCLYKVDEKLHLRGKTIKEGFSVK